MEWYTHHALRNGIIIIFVVVGTVTFVYTTERPLSGDVEGISALQQHAQQATLNLGNTTIRAELARTPEERHVGLSGRERLADGDGMFFIHSEDGLHGIWMPDMRFSIDVIWFDNDGAVVHLEEDVTPESYPKVFFTPTLSRYILEVPLGFIQQHDIVRGMTLTIE